MQSVEKDTVCPCCHAQHTVATPIDEASEVPHDGDFSICMRCGAVLVFDSAKEGGLREPYVEEEDEIEHDAIMQDALAAWRYERRQWPQ